MIDGMQRAATPLLRFPIRPSTRAVLLTLAPLLIAAVAFGIRLYGLDWDGGRGYHPDERSIYMRADQMWRTLTDAPGWEANANRDFPLDEPGVPGPGTFLDADKSPLNPHWFPLGSIIIYLLLIARAVLELFMDRVRPEDIASAARAITAFVDAASVLMLFHLGRRVFSRGVGLLAAGLGAFTVVNIQLAHFYRPEPFVVLLALGAFWWMLNVLERGRARDHVGLGLVVGLSFAFRATSLPLLAPLALTYGILAWRLWQRDRLLVPAVAVLGVATKALGAGLLAFAVFAVFQPYALLDFVEFVSDLGWEAGIARTAGQVPYTVQYVGSQNGLYELRQTAVWALGLPLGIAAWGGLALTIGRLWRVRPRAGPHLGEALLAIWVVAVLLTIVTFETKFLRYIAPVLPVMVLLGSRWLTAGYAWARERSALLRPVAVGAIAVVVASTVFYGAAFVTIYAKPHPALQASAWINDNARTGDTMLTDNHWDEGFPDLGRFNVAQLRMYESDTLLKLNDLSRRLASADFIMSYSNRPFGSIARLPERYPYSSSYYNQLFEGNLGYRLEQAFTRYPTLLGVSFAHDPFTRAGVAAPESLPGVESGALTLDLGYADENVTNYDRPLVLIWRNVEHLTERETFDRIIAGQAEPSGEPLLLSAEDLKAQREGGTWRDIFSEGGLNGAAPWLVWLLLAELIFLATLPLATSVFRWLPDRGVVLARPLGILLVAWLTWLGASTGVWTFSRGSVFLAIAVVAAASAVLGYRNRHRLWRRFRRHWRYLLTVEVLFIAAYAAFVLIRAANPDLWHPWRGGEKPMDLAYLTAVVKSTTMPPFDPWYAGGYLNYYYFGQFIIATLIKATGIVPAVAYNLAVPLLFALTLTSAFSVAHNLAEALRQRRYPHISSRTTFAAGMAAALLVVVLGNLDGAAQLLQNAARWAGGEGFGNFDFWRSSRLMPGQISITEFPFWTFLFADLHAHLIAIPFYILALGLITNLVLSAHAPVSFLRRAPAVGVMALAVGSLAAINTWDVPAFAALALAAVGIMVPARRPLELGTVLRWAGWAIAFWAVAYFAFLPFHQSYDVPSAGVKLSQWRTVFWHYLGVHGLLLFLVASWVAVEAYRRFLSREQLSPGPGAALAVSAGVGRGWSAGHRWRLGALLGLAPLVAIAANRRFPRRQRLSPGPGAAPAVSQGVPLQWDASNRWRLGVLVGLSLVMAVEAYQRFLSRERLSPSPGATPAVLAGAARPWDAGQRRRLSVLVSLALLVAALWASVPGLREWTTALVLAALLLTTLTLAASWARRRHDAAAPVHLLLLAMVVAAVGIGIGVDVVTAQNDIDRMNTVFKLYLNAWVPFGIVGSVGLWHLWASGALRWHGPGRHWRRAWMVALTILVLSSAVFPVLGTRARLADRFQPLALTLDGTAYQLTAAYTDPGPNGQATAPGSTYPFASDADALEYMRLHIDGSPVVLEGVTSQYRWTPRVAVYTGLPVVVGWEWHQIQQRGSGGAEPARVRRRIRDVETMYSTTDTTLFADLLRKYDVSYAYVGPTERLYFPEAGIAKFDALVGSTLERFYANAEVTVYRVR